MDPGYFPSDHKFVLHRGTANNLPLTFVDALGAAVDLSGLTFAAEVKESETGAVLMAMAIDTTDAATGQITLSWEAADSADLPLGIARFGLIDSDDFLWIEDTVTIRSKTPTNIP